MFSRWKIIEINVTGIKCDNCTWNSPDVQSEQYHEWLNAPCPQCGANLLTQADYDTTKRLQKAGRIMNLLFGWLGYVPFINKTMRPVPMSMNGTGRVEIGDVS